MRKRGAAYVGVADHAGWAMLITVDEDGILLDRRRVELIDEGLPKLPHHHEAQSLPSDAAVELIDRVRACAGARARSALSALVREMKDPVVGIAMRRCPDLPESVLQRIADYRAQCVADTVMYREALAEAAREQGIGVQWYEPKRVFAAAARALQRESIADLLAATGARLGPPWQRDHRMAMAAAISASQDRA